MDQHETCSRCGRKLKTAKSRQDGFGPVCLRKHNADMAKAEQISAEQEGYIESEKNA